MVAAGPELRGPSAARLGDGDTTFNWSSGGPENPEGRGDEEGDDREADHFDVSVVREGEREEAAREVRERIRGDESFGLPAWVEV